MVDIDEVDAENEPLRGRHPDGAYHKRPPTLGDRWDAFARCWDHCHLSMAIWVTLVAFTVIIVLGIIVLRANQSAATNEFPRCNRIHNWCLAFVILTTINTVWYSIEEGFRVPAFVSDPSQPGGVREIPYHEQNSTAFTYVRALRLILMFGLVLSLFITGWDMLRTNGVPATSCVGHTDLVLYFKVLFYAIGTGMAMLALGILCGGLITCAALFSNVQERRRAREAEP